MKEQTPICSFHSVENIWFDGRWACAMCLNRRPASAPSVSGESQGSDELDVEAMAHRLARAFGKESRHNPAWVLHNWHALCGISAPHHVEDCRRFALRSSVPAPPSGESSARRTEEKGKQR